MKKLRLFGYAFFSSVGVFAPLAVAASCGKNDSTAPQTNTSNTNVLTKAKTMLEEIRANVTSPHDDVSYNNAPVVDADITKIEYFTASTATTLEEAQNSLNWSEILPNVVAEMPNDRVLYARTTFRADLKVEDSDRYYDLTETSSVKYVKVRFSTSHFNSDLARKLKISGDASASTSLTLTEPELPNGVQLTYKISNNGPLLTKNELINEINKIRESLKIADLSEVKANLIIHDTFLFYDESKSYSIDFSAVKLVTNPSVSEVLTLAKNSLASLQAGPNSLHDKVVFENIPNKTLGVAGVEYFSSETATLEEAITKTSWSQNLPGELSEQKNNRHLFARINLDTSYASTTEQDRYVDLTTSSRIQEVKLNFAKTVAFNLFSFNKLQLTGDLNSAAPIIALNEQNIAPQGTSLMYQIDGGLWVTKAQMVSTLTALGKAITQNNLNSLKAKLTVTDLATYGAGEWQGNVDTAAFVLFRPIVGPTVAEVIASAGSALQSLRVTATSLHDNVAFQNVPSTISNVGDIEYLSTTLTSAANAKAASGWSRALPTQINEVNSSRHLFARVTLASPYVPTSDDARYFDLTTSSRIQEVKVNFAKTVAFANFVFSKLRFQGNINDESPNITIIEENNAPTGTTLTYQINGGIWMTKAAFINNLINIGKNLSAEAIGLIRAKLTVSDLITYGANEWIGAPSTTGLVPFAAPAELPYLKYPTTTIEKNGHLFTTVGEIGGFTLEQSPAPWSTPTDSFEKRFALSYKPAGSKASILERFIDKIIRRLSYGPEIGMAGQMLLKIDNTPFAPEGAAYTPNSGAVGGMANFAYAFGKIYQLKLGDYSIQEGIKSLNVSYDVVAEMIAEQAFQTMFHEYGHNMQVLYLSRNFAQIYPERTEFGVVNKDYYNNFYNTLNLGDTSINSFAPDETIDMRKSGNGVLRVAYINNHVSLADLYKIGNGLYTKNVMNDGLIKKVSLTSEEAFPELLKTPDLQSYGADNYFLTAGSRYNGTTDQRRSFANSGGIDYLYSFEEIETRMMLQALMTFEKPEDPKYGYQLDGLVHGANESIRSIFLDDNWLYANGIDTLDNSQPKTIFYNNYLFKKIINPDGTFSIDRSHADALYEGRVKLMGYRDKANISVFNYDDSVGIENPKRIKFGGFIPSSMRNKRYVGYYDTSNRFVSVPIHIFPFNVKPKSALNATTADPLSPDYYNDCYAIDEAVNIREWENKDLFFADDNNGLNKSPLTTINPTAAIITRNNGFDYVEIPKIVNGRVQLQSTPWEEWTKNHPMPLNESKIESLNAWSKRVLTPGAIKIEGTIDNKKLVLNPTNLVIPSEVTAEIHFTWSEPFSFGIEGANVDTVATFENFDTIYQAGWNKILSQANGAEVAEILRRKFTLTNVYILFSDKKPISTWTNETTGQKYDKSSPYKYVITN